VLRRALVLMAAAFAALVVAAPASALRVHVRVEGVRTTVFGATEPLVRPYVGTIANDGGAWSLSAPTPLGALERASRGGDFYYRFTLEFGAPFVDRIGRYASEGPRGWVYKVNGVFPPVAAGDYVLKEGDRVLWYYSTFGGSGGSPTLDLVRRDGCFRAFMVDDSGARTAARNVVFRLDSRSAARASGQICPRGHWHTLRATKRGAIRSELVRASG